MSFQTIIVRKEAPVAEVILNRPEVLNAMNATMDEELYKALWELRQDKTVKAVVIRGSGRAFTSGQDVRKICRSLLNG